jgi:hypothetical protein
MATSTKPRITDPQIVTIHPTRNAAHWSFWRKAIEPDTKPAMIVGVSTIKEGAMETN